MDLKPFAEAYRETNRRLVQLLDFLSALHQLSEVNPAMTDRRRMLSKALQGLLENRDMCRCSVFLREGDRLVNAAGLSWAELVGPGRDSEGGHAFGLDEGILGRALQTGEVQYSSDCANDPAFLALPGAQGASRAGSLICVPIPVSGQVLGVLNVSHAEAHAFGPDEERLLTLYAHFLGQLLSQWRYMNELEDQVRQRTRELEAALGESRALQQRFQSLSVMDELTGLHNRRYFFAEARILVARALRSAEPLAVAVLDLDYFKQVNDRFGHSVGDRVLRDVSHRVRSLIREGDILARLGGEEFVLLLPATDLDGAVKLGKRVRQVVADLRWSIKGEALSVTTSIGLCALSLEAPAQQMTPDEVLESLLARANAALYTSKDAGRDRLRISTLEVQAGG
ncbi:sensor domain-containing diguanylate cyclase [Ectothiorhodospira mobilis]|uniref:GGDEF domain-containing protein n=1 Tax=Ectothiorhodospira mobilis TaxID=195064 RepID=UPI001EE7BF85|nr:sensor domain-containing diguanylate cyclase [Ectothiorhodospira mobilis]MCG5536211.1 sensor domain-containing diguanylate cyclase [Ectothiorhodospira mobilis]